MSCRCSRNSVGVACKCYGTVLRQKRTSKAINTAGIGTVMAVVSWFIFALISFFIIKPYALISAESEIVHEYTITYGKNNRNFQLEYSLKALGQRFFAVTRRYENTYDCSDCRCIDKYRTRPYFNFRNVRIKPMGVAGAAIANCHRSVARRRHNRY